MPTVETEVYFHFKPELARQVWASGGDIDWQTAGVQS